MRTSEIPRPLCGCGTPVTYQGKTVKGFKIWKSGCAACEKRAIKNRKDHCERCGGTERLEIDHIDSDRSNNNPDNLQTLCKNCHNKKSLENKEGRSVER